MSTTRARCPDCGDVELATRDVTVVQHTSVSQYRFRCPRCHVIVIKTCRPRTAELLLDDGAGHKYIDISRLDRRPDCGALTDDELIDCHELWANDDTFWADFEAAS